MTSVGPDFPGSALDQAIAIHKLAYATAIATRDRLWRVHEAFDPDHHLEQPDEVRAALAGMPDPAATTATYVTAELASTTASQAEDDAWTRISTLVPATVDELRTWLDYVIAHATNQDEAVTLQQALVHVAGLLAGKLAA